MQKYEPELDKQCRADLKLTNDSWLVNIAYIKIKGKDRYLYRAVDSDKNTLDFLLSAKRNVKTANCFCRKILKVIHDQTPRVITVNKNAA